MRILSIVAIVALFAAASLQAADETDGKLVAPQPTTAVKTEDQAAKVGTAVETCGKIISTHTVNLVGIADAHVLVKIKTEQGDTDIADLGSAVDLKSNGIEPHEGQQLWVSGRVGRINDKELIVAENLSESKLVTIVRKAPLREESEKHAAARNEGKAAVSGKDGKEAKLESIDVDKQVRIVEGTVIHTRTIKLEGESAEHTLAKLQTESGIVVVDLGDTATLPKVDLGEGKSVVATGFVGHINSKPIIVADSVGNLACVQRPSGPDADTTTAKTPVSEK